MLARIGKTPAWGAATDRSECMFKDDTLLS